MPMPVIGFSLTNLETVQQIAERLQVDLKDLVTDQKEGDSLDMI